MRAENKRLLRQKSKKSLEIKGFWIMRLYLAEVVTACENLEVECIIFLVTDYETCIEACHIVVENKMPGINGITDFKRGKKLERQARGVALST